MSEFKFKLGDLVRWTSQANGRAKTKEGEIVDVLPAGARPSLEMYPALHRSSGCGFGRKHESYVVRVRTRHFWPVAGLLRKLT